MAQPDLSLADTLVRNATWFADTPAYVADGRALTHAQLLARAARLACALAAAGVRRHEPAAGPRVLIAAAESLPLIAEHRARCPGVELVVGIGAPSAGEVVGYEDFIAAAPSDNPPYLALPQDIALLVYTSGTTGRPKGCILGP